MPRRAQRVLARAVMNGETTDAGRLAGHVPDAVRGRPAADDRARSEAILACSLEVAERGERGPQPVPRRDRRGRDRAAAGPARRRRQPSGASGGSCSMGSVPRSIPYDVTVERDGARRGVRLQVGRARHQRRRAAPARRRPGARGRGGRAAGGGAGRLRCRASRARSGWPARPRRPRDRRRHARDARRAGDRSTVTRRPARLHGRRSGSGSTRPARTASSARRRSCAMPRTSPGFHSAERGFDRAWYAERGLTWLARAAAVAVLAPIVRVGDD